MNGPIEGHVYGPGHAIGTTGSWTYEIQVECVTVVRIEVPGEMADELLAELIKAYANL